MGIAAIIALAFGSITAQSAEPPSTDIVLRGGLVVDGTGKPGYVADVAIQGERIGAIGKVEIGPKTKVIDVSGRVIAPGFIDLHSHSDGSILGAKTRHNLN